MESNSTSLWKLVEAGRPRGNRRDTGTVAAQGDSTQPPLSKGGVPWTGDLASATRAPPSSCLPVPRRLGEMGQRSPAFYLFTLLHSQLLTAVAGSQDQSLTPVRCIRLSSLLVTHFLPSLHLCDPTPKTPAKIPYPSWSDFSPPTLRTFYDPLRLSLFFPFCSQFAFRFTIRTRSDLDLHSPPRSSQRTSTNHHLSSTTRLSSCPLARYSVCLPLQRTIIASLSSPSILPPKLSTPPPTLASPNLDHDRADAETLRAADLPWTFPAGPPFELLSLGE